MSNFATPTIPEWIKSINHPGYRNIFSYNLGNKNLWGTESLLGDWKAPTLLIAKDFYPTKYIEAGIKNGVDNPYQHKAGIPTNRNLIKTLSHFRAIPDPLKNTDCGFLYISACFLLRDDGIIRGALPDEKNVMSLSWPVVEFTLRKMPRLERIVLLGTSAKAAVAQNIKNNSLLSHVSIHNVSHPARALSDDDRFSEWEPILSAK